MLKNLGDGRRVHSTPLFVRKACNSCACLPCGRKVVAANESQVYLSEVSFLPTLDDIPVAGGIFRSCTCWRRAANSSRSTALKKCSAAKPRLLPHGFGSRVVGGVGFWRGGDGLILSANSGNSCHRLEICSIDTCLLLGCACVIRIGWAR